MFAPMPPHWLEGAWQGKPIHTTCARATANPRAAHACLPIVSEAQNPFLATVEKTRLSDECGARPPLVCTRLARGLESRADAVEFLEPRIAQPRLARAIADEVEVAA